MAIQCNRPAHYTNIGVNSRRQCKLQRIRPMLRTNRQDNISLRCRHFTRGPLQIAQMRHNGRLPKAGGSWLYTENMLSEPVGYTG